jgi:hypothetical protein
MHTLNFDPRQRFLSGVVALLAPLLDYLLRESGG